ncbi:hypothetical protein V8E54_014726 [Elaphomyces granulatus]
MAEPTQIKAEIYKLVLYEEGAFFLPHQDSEKADGMFGTLVVSLPSKHEGGDVVASHRGESRTFSSSSASEFDYSYAAWYSDITHEVKPVTSGYRIVLTYNLIHRPSAMLLGSRDNLTPKLTSDREGDLLMPRLLAVHAPVHATVHREGDLLMPLLLAVHAPVHATVHLPQQAPLLRSTLCLFVITRPPITPARNVRQYFSPNLNAEPSRPMSLRRSEEYYGYAKRKKDEIREMKAFD